MAMKNIYIYIFTLFLTPPFMLTAQTTVSRGYTGLFESRLSGEHFDPKTNYLGSPYLTTKWLRADITLTSGKTIHHKLIRYNEFKDELIWLAEPDYEQIQLDKPLLSSFVLKEFPVGKTMVFNKIAIKPILAADTIHVFAQLLFKHVTTLYVQRKIVSGGYRVFHTGNSMYRKEILEPDPVYYILLPDKSIYFFRKIRRKKILSFWPEHKKRLKKEFRTYKVRLHNEEGLIKSMPFIDNLFDAQ